MIRIQNVVAKIDLKQELNLKKIMLTLTEADTRYEPAIFPGLVVKMNSVSFLLFNRGSGICVGAKSVSSCIAECRKMYGLLLEKGLVEDRGIEVDIRNVVASADLGFRLDVERASETLERVIYEPEIFPAAIWYMERPRVSLLLFQSGKVIIAGARSEEEVTEAYRKAIVELSPLRLERTEAATA